MGLLDSLLQGGQDRDDYQNVVNRYDQGPPYEGISTTRRSGAISRSLPNSPLTSTSSGRRTRSAV
jgi:hypothetical protein